jgi:hypothetical protein
MADDKPKTSSKPKSIADILQDWEDLMAASLDKADRLGPAEPQRLALEDLIKRAKEMRARHEAIKADKLQLTQDFRALRKEGEETARRLRSAVKANIGTRSELLKQFNVAPNGPRPRKSKATGEKPPAGGTPTGGTPTVKAAKPAAGGDGQ